MPDKKKQGGPAYAPLPPRYYIFGHYDVWDKAQMLKYADDTHELRLRSLQAKPEAAPQQATSPTADVVEKMISNTWDHFGDILPTLKAISRGDWYWGANTRCKYIEIRIDTRDGGCILYDSKRVRISPQQFAHQSHDLGKMDPWPHRNALDVAPAAKFKVGDLVTKTKGSQWKGRVVGTYSTTLTPEGYAVESSTERGSVQIYPATALELVQEALAEQSAITSESGTPPAEQQAAPKAAPWPPMQERPQENTLVWVADPTSSTCVKGFFADSVPCPWWYKAGLVFLRESDAAALGKSMRAVALSAPKAAPGASELAAIEKEIAETCMNTPPGWRCTRKAGHDGPCAAVSCPEDLEFVAKGMKRLQGAEEAPQQEVSQDTMYLLRRLLSNQHTLTGSEFRAELEKIVGEAYQRWAQEPGEIDRLRAALVYTAFALHGMPQYMLADGIVLIDGDTVQVSRDGWTVQASANPLRQSAQPAPAPLSEQDERRAFEQDFMRVLPGENLKRKFGHYEDPRTRHRWDGWKARAVLAKWGTPQPAPRPLSEREEIAMVDAAMVEMANIVPPLKRSECARLIRAALAAQGGKT